MIASPETIQEALYNALRALGGRPDYREARLEVELLLGHALEMSRAQVLARLGEPLDAAVASRFAAMVARRAQAEPLAYILGHQEFYSLDLIVDRRVMVPRQETEIVVERALDILEHAAWLNPCVVDVGTGSGAIVLALAARVKRSSFLAVDVSTEALEVARINAQRLELADRIVFRQGDLLDPITEPIDLVVANLPYIPAARERELPREVRAFEPRIALISGLDGLSANRRLLQQAKDRLRRGARVLIEISEEQGPEALAMARQFSFTEVTVRRDLEGLDRMVDITV